MKILFYTLDKNIIVPKKYLEEKNPDIIIAYGGDGTFLSAVKQYLHLDVPFYGIAAGTLNFLLNQHLNKNIKHILKDISSNKIKINFKETPTLNVSLNGIELSNAVNDVVIGDSLRSYSSMNITSDIDLNKSIKCSGILVSTPLGSTAMNLNNGGHPVPIKYPIWQISTIVANDNFHKVLNDTKDNVNLKIEKTDDRYETLVVIDGKMKAVMNQGDVLTFKVGKNFRIGFKDFEDFNLKRI